LKRVLIPLVLSIALHGLLLRVPRPPEERAPEAAGRMRPISIRIAPLKAPVKRKTPRARRRAETSSKKPPSRPRKAQAAPAPTSPPKPKAPEKARNKPRSNPQPKPKPKPARTSTPLPPPVQAAAPSNKPLRPAEPARETAQGHPPDTTHFTKKALTKEPEQIQVSSRRLVGGYQVMPLYPRAARREGREGVVVLEILVLEDGRVGKVSVKRSSGFQDLDRAAEEALRRWSFDPARENGRPVRQSALLPIRFALE